MTKKKKGVKTSAIQQHHAFASSSVHYNKERPGLSESENCISVSDGDFSPNSYNLYVRKSKQWMRITDVAMLQLVQGLLVTILVRLLMLYKVKLIELLLNEGIKQLFYDLNFLLASFGLHLDQSATVAGTLFQHISTSIRQSVISDSNSLKKGGKYSLFHLKNNNNNNNGTVCKRQ